MRGSAGGDSLGTGGGVCGRCREGEACPGGPRAVGSVASLPKVRWTIVFEFDAGETLQLCCELHTYNNR